MLVPPEKKARGTNLARHHRHSSSVAPTLLTPSFSRDVAPCVCFALRWKRTLAGSAGNLDLHKLFVEGARVRIACGRGFSILSKQPRQPGRWTSVETCVFADFCENLAGRRLMFVVGASWRRESGRERGETRPRAEAHT